MLDDLKGLIEEPGLDIEMSFLDCFEGRNSFMFRIGFGKGMPKTARQFTKLIAEIQEAITVLDGDERFAREVAGLRDGLKWAERQKRRLVVAERLRRASEEAYSGGLEDWQIRNLISAGQDLSRRKADENRGRGAAHMEKAR